MVRRRHGARDGDGGPQFGGSGGGGVVVGVVRVGNNGGSSGGATRVKYRWRRRRSVKRWPFDGLAWAWRRQGAPLGLYSKEVGKNRERSAS